MRRVSSFQGFPVFLVCIHSVEITEAYTQISPLRKRVIRIHVPFLSRRSHTLLYICMWKVDYGCIDLVPPTPPLFNLFLSGGTIMSSQKGKKSRLPGTQKYLFPSHHARGSYNNVSAPYKICDTSSRTNLYGRRPFTMYGTRRVECGCEF